MPEEWAHARHDLPALRVPATFTTEWVSPSYTQHGMTVQDGAVRCNNSDCRRVLGARVDTSNISIVLDYWPKLVGGKEFPDVPEHIALAADEAHQCLSIGAHRGAIALARAVVEATAKDHEVMNGNLAAKISALAEKGVISEAMKDAANEIRFAGNEVAHGDLAEQPIDSEDALEVLELMDAILTRVYQEPAQVAKVRARRESRRGN